MSEPSRKKKKLILPQSGIILPPTPFEKRIENFTSHFPQNIPPEDSEQGIEFQHMMDGDPQFQVFLKQQGRRLFHFLNARMQDGSGLRMSKHLRSFFFEYLDRISKHGPHSLPTSFNIVEAFL
jgi:hypothetical protein